MADNNIFDEIKKRVNLVEIVGEDYQLKGYGTQYRGDSDETSSLVVVRNSISGEWYYYWNSKNEGGDVFNWLKNQRGMDTKSALELAAQKAGITLPEWKNRDTKGWLTARATEDAFSVAAGVFHKWGKANEAFVNYCRGRGWVDETISNAKLGFSGFATATDFKEMRETLAMNNIATDSPAAVVIMGFKGGSDAVAKLQAKWEQDLDLKDAISNDDISNGYIPGFMTKPRLIYPHLYFQKVVYLSSRNLVKAEDGRLVSDPGQTKSFNPRRSMAGERQPYYAWNYRAHGDNAASVVIVEGQADAITLAQWGFNVMGANGLVLDDYTAKELRGHHKTRYLAFDKDAAGWTAVFGKRGDWPIAEKVGPLAHVVNWPRADRQGTLKDANDLRQSYVRRGMRDDLQAKLVRVRLNASLTVAELAGMDAAKRQKDRSLSTEEQNGAMVRAFDIAAMVAKDEMMPSLLMKFLRAFDMGVSNFNKGLKIARGERGEDTTDDSKPKETKFIYGGWFPLEEGSKRGWLVDYLWESQMGKAMFAYRDPDGRIGKATHVDIKGVRYYPKVDENIRAGGVMFASDLGQEKSTRELLAWNDLYMRRSFLLDNPLDYKLAAYYAQFTWLYDCFDELAYIRAQGESDSGKSAIILRLLYVSYRMTKSSGVGTAASFKHMQHMYRGTMFFDEIKDDLDEFDDRVVMLNIGAMKEQAFAPMMTSFKNADGEIEFEVVNFYVYGPKACTMYGKFPQDATESRFLTIKTIKHELSELREKNIPRRWTDEMRAQALYKRNLDMTWRLKNWQPRLQPPDSLEDMRVSTRVNQVTVPIKYILTMNPENGNGQQAQQALEEINLVVKNLYEEQKFDKLQKTEARIIEAIDAVLRDSAFTILNFVQNTELKDWGTVKYIRYSDLTKVVNYLIDEMNLGTGKSPEQAIKPGDDDAEQGDDKPKKKGKKRFAPVGVTASTIGTKCRALRIPVHKMGRGFVVIIHSDARPDEVQDRLELLKMRFGLDDLKGETSIEQGISTSTAPNIPNKPDESPVQESLL